MSTPILSVAVRHEHDIVTARQRARQIAALVGFDTQDQTRIATAVSEIARNAFTYGGGGRVEYALEGELPPQLFVIRISDTGRGISDVEAVLSGAYRSRTGMGLGIAGARRLMDQFHLESSAAGTTVWLKKLLPRRSGAFRPQEVAGFADSLAREQPVGPIEELQQQNRELLRTLEELRRRQEELVRLNQELEDTNRGVVALYAELDEKADHLRRADQLKSKFLSNMSHEFRTPLNSIIALSNLLFDRMGPGSRERETEVFYIHKAAQELAELVNDLLDLAKVEAGKITVRPGPFDVAKLFGALRGMLRPLLLNEAVRLVFEDPVDVPTMQTDEGKVSQILRNFISNALKFTERGEVRVSSELKVDEEAVVFRVADTGIGIDPANQQRIFEEFSQVENRFQRKVRGTGLGLPLSRRLAELLGGRIELESTPGVGSTFSLVVPIRYSTSSLQVDDMLLWEVDPSRVPILVVEDAFEDQLVYSRLLPPARFQIFAARTLADADRALARIRPRAILLDVRMGEEESWGLLARLKDAPETGNIPVIVASALEERRKALALGADAYTSKPVDAGWLMRTLDGLLDPGRNRRILIVDDHEPSRFVLKQLLAGHPAVLLEAADGEQGLRRVSADRPDLVLLDLNLPGRSGEEVLRELRQRPDSRALPVIVVTSRLLGETEAARLEHQVSAVLSKDGLSRDRLIAAVEHALRQARVGVSA